MKTKQLLAGVGLLSLSSLSFAASCGSDSMFIRGTNNNWDSTPMHCDDGVWRAKNVYFEPADASPQFKFDVLGDWGENYGMGSEGEAVLNGQNIPATLGSYDIAFDYVNKTYGLEKNTRPITDEVFYFVMPDRFANGDATNDNAGLAEDPMVSGFDPTSKKFYHGGDLAGLKSKLNYIKRLGATSIWMTPVFKNQPVQGEGANASAGYHGYWTLDFTTIDPHLGTSEELKDLIKEAHAMGMKVFFDIVINHTADVIKYGECHNPDGSNQDGIEFGCPYRSSAEVSSNPYSPFIPEGNELAKSPDWLNNITLYHNQGDSTFAGESSLNGDFFGLDDLKTEDPQVVSGMIDIFKSWISDYNIDGYRVDTVKHVNIEFWQQWAPAIQEHATSLGRDDFFIFGEVFDGNPENNARYTTEGKLPSVLDFGLYYQLSGVFGQDWGVGALEWAFSNDDRYTDADSHANTLLNFAGNHDTGRIGHVIMNAHPDASEEEKLARAKLANAFLFFARGIPVIYYGDEQGFTGDGSSDDSREDMMPTSTPEFADNDLLGTDATHADSNFDRKHPLYQAIKQYARLYKKHAALRSGAQIERLVDGQKNVYAFSRIDWSNPKEYLVAFNASTKEQTITLPATAKKYRQLGSQQKPIKRDKDGNIQVTLPALSHVVLKGTQKVKSLGDAISATFSTTSPGQGVFGQVELGVNVQLDGVDVTTQALPVYAVHYEVSANDGPYSSLGTDYNPSYKVFFSTNDYSDGDQLSVRATITDIAGNSTQIEQDLVVDIPPVMAVDFKKPEGWNDLVNIHFWGSEAGSTQWPGEIMTNQGDNVYRFTFPLGTTFANLIFNDGASQTDNLERAGSGCYDLASSAWYDSCADIPEEDTGPYPVQLFVRGNMNEWGSANPFEYLGNNQYSATVDLAQGTASFKIADEGWGGDTTFSGYWDEQAQAKDIVVETNVEKRLQAEGPFGGDPLQLNADVEGNHHFLLTVDGLATEPLLLVTPPAGDEPPAGVDIFLRGSMNDWSEANPFSYAGNGVYTASREMFGISAFKIASSDWSVDFGAAGSNILTVDTPMDLTHQGVNIEFTSADTLYDFSFDWNAETLSVSEGSIGDGDDTPPYPMTIYVRGSFNSWSGNNPMTYAGSGTYDATIALDGNPAFKIASEDWSVDFGAAGNSEVTIGQPMALGHQGANLQLNNAAGDYQFLFNSNDDTLTVSQ